MKNTILKRIQESLSVKQKVLENTLIHQQIEGLALDCLTALKNGRKVIFAGNGGSFADAQHLSAEFVSRFMFDRSPLASVALGTNSSAMSAIGNDYGYEQVFARELRGVAQKGDVFIGISTSGNSPNIILAVNAAKELNLRSMVWTGESGGSLVDSCECLKVPSSQTARIQECHILLGHILCELIEYQFFKDRLI